MTQLSDTDSNVLNHALSEPVATVILAAGLGTRMRSTQPKAMHPVGGMPMINHVQKATRDLSPEVEIVVVGPDMQDLRRAASPAICVEQTERLGTAHAVLAAKQALQPFTSGSVFVLFGDSPFLPPATLLDMARARASGAAVVALGFYTDDPTNYGRMILDEEGGLQRIVEERDANSEEKAIKLCNSGVMCLDASRLFPLLEQIDNNNRKGEYYLTDIIRIARAQGLKCAAIHAPEADLMGVDSKADLAKAEARFQKDRRDAALDNGVTLLDPATVWFSYDTMLSAGVEVGRNVVFGPGVTVEEGAFIKDFSHIEGAVIRKGASVGPFARLRPGTELGAGARVGNFVEIKNTVLGDGAKVNHLSYLGDASIGAIANIGAGTITCNYDGFNKANTKIGEGAFIGSNTALVAPISIGDGALVGAGSTLSSDVAPEALALERAETIAIESGAKKFREKAQAEKQKRLKNSIKTD